MQADLALILESGNSPYTQTMRDSVRALLPTGEELTDEQVRQVWYTYNILSGFTRIREFAWFQYQDGLLDQRVWEGCMATLARNLSSDIGRVLWAAISQEMDPEFVAYVDSRLPAAPVSPD